MTLYPDKKDKLVNLLNQFSAYALNLGASPKELRSWIEMQIQVHEHVGIIGEPNHEDRLYYIVNELCRFAPEVGIPLEAVLGWVQNRIEFRDEGLRIMRGKNPPPFEDIAPEAGRSDSSID